MAPLMIQPYYLAGDYAAASPSPTSRLPNARGRRRPATSFSSSPTKRRQDWPSSLTALRVPSADSYRRTCGDVMRRRESETCRRLLRRS